MSEPRLKYGQLAPEGLAKMTALEHYLNNGTGLEASLLGRAWRSGAVRRFIRSGNGRRWPGRRR